MSRKLFGAIALSVVIHAIALRLTRTAETPTVPPPVVVELAPTPSSKASTGRAGGGGQRALGSLMLKDGDFATPRPGIAYTAPTAEERAAKGTPMQGMARDGSLLFVHELVRSHLSYPDEFEKHSIEGKVQAVIEFSEHGRYLHKRTSIHATSPYLRVLVLIAFRHAFAEDLPETKRAKVRSRRIPCKFEFALTGSKQLQGIGATHVVQGETLYFYKERVRPVVSSGMLESRIHGTLGFAKIDVLGLVNQITGESPEGKGVDALEKYRRDPDWEA